MFGAFLAYVLMRPRLKKAAELQDEQYRRSPGPSRPPGRTGKVRFSKRERAYLQDHTARKG